MKPCLLALGIQTALPITLQARHDAASGGVVKSKKAGSLAPTELKLKADRDLSCHETEMAPPFRRPAACASLLGGGAILC
jgi:hypothetical protein